VKGGELDMTKMDVVDAVATHGEMTKTDAARALDVVLDVMSSSLAKGEKVTVTGFGTFEVRHRRARTGRNPQNGKPIQIPETKSPAFKAGKGLKDAVR